LKETTAHFFLKIDNPKIEILLFQTAAALHDCCDTCGGGAVLYAKQVVMSNEYVADHRIGKFENKMFKCSIPFIPVDFATYAYCLASVYTSDAVKVQCRGVCGERVNETQLSHAMQSGNSSEIARLEGDMCRLESFYKNCSLIIICIIHLQRYEM
jgi:hypothetical protein